MIRQRIHRSFPAAGALILSAAASFLPGCAPDPLEPLPVGPTDGWTVIHPLPVGYDLNDAWGENDRNVWAVGDRGVIVHWDGGPVQRVDSPSGEHLVTLDGWGPDDLYAAGGPDLVHYDGRAWDLSGRFPGEIVLDLLCAPDGRLYLAGTMGVVYREDDRWVTLPGPSVSTGRIWLGPDQVVRVGDIGWVWRIDAASATVEQDFGELQVRFGDGGYLGLEGPAGQDTIRRFVPGQGWDEEVGSLYSLRALLDGGDPVWADNGGISTPAGDAWDNHDGRWVYGLARCGDDGIIACGSGGTLMLGRPETAGFAWEESAQSIGFRYLNAFSGSSCDDFWAAEWYGRVLHFQDGVWTLEHALLPGDAAVAGIQDLGYGWVVAHGGGRLSLRHPADGWSELPDPGEAIVAFCALAPDRIFAGTGTRFILHDGDGWRGIQISAGLAKHLAATPAGAVFALTPEGGSTLRRYDGQTFVPVAVMPGIDPQFLCPSRTDETLWIGGYSGSPRPRSIIYRFTGGTIEDVTLATMLPGFLVGMTELRSDDLFVLAGSQVWRRRGGRWAREPGLPVDENYQAIWSCPEGSVLVQGHPTFSKDYSDD